MNIIEILKVLVFGIVEGFTEWLPISSTGHMILLDEIIPLTVSKDFKDMIEVVIQLGAILAVVVLYFHKLNPFSPSKTDGQKRATIRLWSKIIVACVPVAVVGLLVNDWMEAHLMNSYVVSSMLILYGLLFIAIEIWNQDKKPIVEKTGQISYQMAFCIGLIQLLSLVPGTSRSGVTILGAMLLGCSRGISAEFTFFLGIPVMFGASGLKLVKFFLSQGSFTGTEVFYLIFGMVVAFVVSVYSIKFLMGYIRKNSFSVFGIYRIVLGVIVLGYFGISKLLA